MSKLEDPQEHEIHAAAQAAYAALADIPVELKTRSSGSGRSLRSPRNVRAGHFDRDFVPSCSAGGPEEARVRSRIS
jgi:hypothetical protein